MTQEMRVRGFLEWISPYFFLSPTERLPPPLRSAKTQDLGTPLPKTLKRQDPPSVFQTATQLCPTFCDPMDCSLSAPLSIEFSRQEYWSALPFPSPGDLLDPGIEPGPPTLKADSLPPEPLFIYHGYSLASLKGTLP